ncbi:hypothetical protein [Clostridium sp. JN-9]|uniref:hypothetical protein n=1 Tax=Clostridium sp. JN-9 TaxID=2507159 RepID=UPI000FFE3085|nr:hypothetical protein [Clostridium sp. JN-9]QAT39827.1 hypothetical protein EQM05_05935 [Clostridium sp. JN-9]
MIDEKNISEKGSAFLKLSLYALLGVLLELLILLIEILVYGKSINHLSFTGAEKILHWILTCITWTAVSYQLIKTSREKYKFDIFKYRNSLDLKNWLLCLILLTVSISNSLIDWNGFKVLKEFLYYGWLQFIFQYIYYLFETILVVLIIIFAQKAGEIWFRKDKIPWGGIFVGSTWGLLHIVTKFQLYAGLSAFIEGLLFGVAYLASRKDLRIAYPLIFLMFVL